ncbi:FtsX-like permease family protein [Paenibacillus antri]|uniref:FtsX-like permease family protein n=1 Tax=Paenibacillus antri TaxID=2582848 RepID=A0A5R9GAR3_9BACL|nr:ABC transporter permease [Paenibacillus antri]TLS51180.1 FtsX-like permease family protein [Paenibacillus antri]
MTIFENLAIALDNLRGNKMRSFLTIIGIVVGIAAVVTVVSIGQAGQSSIVSDIAKYGEGYFVVLPGGEGGGTDADLLITSSDLDAVRKLEGIAAAAGTTSARLTTTIRSTEYRLDVTGTPAEYAKLAGLDYAAGGYFTAAEERSRQRVLVVADKFATEAFGGAQAAMNQRLKFGGRVYRIIGVYETEESLLSGLGGTVYGAYAPSGSLPGASGSVRYGYVELLANTGNTEELRAIVADVKELLAKRHNASPTDYLSQTGEEAQQQVSQVFSILQIIIGSIAGISLFVGGIGVMNIMLVSVTERTREIGIRKAIGATPGLIMAQFMIEAVILTLLGGLLGAGIGLLASWAFSVATQWPFLVSWWALLLAVGFSTVVGIFFGLYPASKAARMQPIESLRYE